MSNNNNFATIWKRVRQVGDCWVWQGSTGRGGYGQIWIRNRPTQVHRYSFRLWKGPIPSWLELDHLCRVPSCVNPEHLEAVTNRENVLRGNSFAARNARKTHCPQGHEYTEENTNRWGGRRKCLTCNRRSCKQYYYRQQHLKSLVALRPVSGGSCHPCHPDGPPAPGVSDEQRERYWAEFFKNTAVDPRAINRHHKWKPGHEPDYEHPDSGWRTLNIKWEGEKAPPDQRHLLKGGPPVAMDCEQCGSQLHAVGEMSRWEQMNQYNPEQGIDVRPVNIDSITEERKKELQSQMIVILACPQCLKKYQFDKEFLPRDG